MRLLQPGGAPVGRDRPERSARAPAWVPRDRAERVRRPLARPRVAVDWSLARAGAPTPEADRLDRARRWLDVLGGVKRGRPRIAWLDPPGSSSLIDDADCTDRLGSAPLQAASMASPSSV